MANGSYQHSEVLHATGQHSADQEPQESGCESELRGKSGPHKWSGAGDGGEVMPEQHPLWRSNVVVTVGVKVPGSRAPVIQGKGLSGDERAVIPVGQSVDT